MIENYKSYYSDENSNIKTKIGVIEYRDITDHRNSDDPLTIIRYSYDNLFVNKYYCGRIGGYNQGYVYIGYKYSVDYSMFLVFGYSKYLHLVRLYNNIWTDESVL